MGDGGVACAPTQLIMEKFPVCGGKTNSKTQLNSSSNSSIKLAKVKPKMKPKKGKVRKLANKNITGWSKEVVENDCNGEVSINNNDEEVEEGELGTLPIEIGEYIPERPTRRYEIKSDIEMGEFVPGRWRRNADESERNELRSSKDELEKGEFVPERWYKSEFGHTADHYGYSNTRRYDTPKQKERKYDHEWASPSAKERGWNLNRDNEWTQPYAKEKKWKADYEWSPSSGKEKGWKGDRDREREWTPPSSGKYSSEKEFSKNGGFNQQFRKFASRYEAEKTPKSSYEIAGEEGFSKSDLSNGKNHARDYSFNNRLKRHGNESDSNERKYYDEYTSSKNWKLSDDQYSGRPYKKAALSSSSRNIPSEKYSSRYSDSSRSVNDRSLNDWALDHDRARSPAVRDRSPYEWAHQKDRNGSPYDRKGRYDDRSQLDRGRYRETNRKAGAGDKRPTDQRSKEQEVPKESESKENLDNGILPIEKETDNSHSKNEESSLENGVTEEPASMEEDMDICDTPPHVSLMVDAVVSGKWYYLDEFGEERGPAKLSDLKTLAEEGYLASDHFIKHLDSVRWVCVENAVSPLMPASFPSVVPDSVTQLACPPEASGNVLEDNGKGSTGNLAGDDMVVSSLTTLDSDNGLDALEPVEGFHIDERIGSLLEGVTLIPGKELEMIAEMLERTTEHGDWEQWRNVEGYIYHQLHMVEHHDGNAAKDLSSVSEYALKNNELCSSDTIEWFSGQWTLKGGDWKRNDEATLDNRTWKRKVVLNNGYPLGQMPKSGCEDPRRQRKDELYFPSQSRKLDLPSWAFTSLDELNDPMKSSETKCLLVRGIKGTMLPVIRINACVVNEHGSFVSESRVKVRGKERCSAKPSHSYSITGDMKRSSEDSHSKSSHEIDGHDSWKKSVSFDIPKDRLCKVDELQLHLGDWYYLDGAGYERGPSSFSELQGMADKGVVQKHSSVFRKQDKLWVPLNVLPESSGIAEHEDGVTSSNLSPEAKNASGGLHELHPQFIGYTRGKLHELVMKSYKSREFAAAINEVLDPWINARQPKKEIEKHTHGFKRARTDGTEEEYVVEEDEWTLQKDECSFDDLCADVTFGKRDGSVSTEVESDSWHLLDGHVLARIFHFLRVDLKSLLYAALTCKHWRSAANFYVDISRQVDFCSISANGSDPMILKIMNNYNKEKITSLILRGCTGITSGFLEEILRSFHCLSTIDIRGCLQLEDLVGKFPHINWIRNLRPQMKNGSLNHLTAKGSNQMEYSSGLKEYLESSDKRDSENQLFRRSLYKRSKLFDARKSSSISSRDAQLRRLSMKKYGNGYKRMEEFIAVSLKEIMKENSFEFFEAKVAEIEQRMKNGYYASRGLNSVKEDISRMCRDAIKTKDRGDARDLNRIVKIFIRLATILEKCSKLAYGKDEIMKSWKDHSPRSLSSSTSSSKYKKNPNKSSERKHSYRSNGSSFVNGFIDSEDFASDKEIQRRLSKLNKKALDSGTDTSDDFDKSSLGSATDCESTASDTESDLEFQSEDSRRETCFTPDNYGFDSVADEREWGARMTKASLVPPVTRKYEVIDHYVIVADEEEVKRKLRVSLPEDYDEKLNAQRTGVEESDMEIPEVKDYKPRKSLGDEVIEQEVYGIDPYTHNLLLDSMPDESDWSLVDKHLFIEDVLLRSLNKKVRNFTGFGNTPMVYPLRPVFEEVLEIAKEGYDKRTMRLCQFILKAIDGRPADNYVAYRKGLGVVCNKEGGFSEDDFVVEFLGEVYPTWKWYEKQDGIRALQKNKDEPALEFYNIYLERPKGDADGYDLVVVDAMHKANYASRICHSCKPNCEAKVTAVDGQYQIGIYSVRPIAYGEEVTFDYNSVTESKDEYEASVCLCGNQVCRGSYLNLTGEGAFQKVLKEHHGLLDRHRLLLEACELNSVTEEDYIDLGKAGLGSCLLGGLPDWLIAYSARLVRFINFERTKLPNEILKHNIEEKKKYFAEIHLDVEKSDAEIQAEGVYNQRLQNLALTIDKVRYVMRCVFGDPKNAPPPLERLSPEAAVSYLWKGEGSFVEELIQCMSPHVEDATLTDLKAKIHAHDPSSSDDIEFGLRKSLLWLRDEVRNLPCTYKSRHDAAADLIHIHAYTKSFIRIREYKTITSPPVLITPFDLGPKYADKLGPGVHEYCKTYGETYCLGQLMFWHSQNAETDALLDKASRGCLSLPDIGSFYAKVQKPSRQRVYGPRTVKFMISRMEKQPQRPWPKDRIWTFKTSMRIVGSPTLDAVLHDTSSMDKEMVHWLKHRPSVFQATWDR